MGYKTSESCECQSARALSSSPRLFSTSLDVLSSFERWVQDKRHCLEQLGCQWRLKWLGRPQLTALTMLADRLTNYFMNKINFVKFWTLHIVWTSVFQTTIINKSLWTLTGKTQTRFLEVFVFNKTLTCQHWHRNWIFDIFMISQISRYPAKTVNLL